MATYYQVVIKYDKMQENGSVKRVSEKYIADALSCTDAEARVTEEMQPFISGDFLATSVKTTPIAEIFNLDAERYYLAKVAFITVDEKTAQEKRSISQILVGASDFKEAYDNFLDGMKGTMADYEIVSLSETQIIEVYPAKV